MKKLFLMIAVLGSFFITSCSEQEIESFGEERFIYFQKFWKDAPAPGTEKAEETGVTFFFAEETDTHVYADLQVVLAGRPLEEDLLFKLRVVEEDGMTTALPEEYKLEEFYRFRAKPVGDATQIDDTIRIQINRSKRLETMEDGYKLTLEVVPTNGVFPGQYERSRAVLHITKNPVRPDWWNKEVEETLLGTYSPLKYKLFLMNVDGAETLDSKMIKENPGKAIQLVRKFQEWLPDKGSEEYYDEDLKEYLTKVSVKV